MIKSQPVNGLLIDSQTMTPYFRESTVRSKKLCLTSLFPGRIRPSQPRRGLPCSSQSPAQLHRDTWEATTHLIHAAVLTCPREASSQLLVQLLCSSWPSMWVTGGCDHQLQGSTPGAVTKPFQGRTSGSAGVTQGFSPCVLLGGSLQGEGSGQACRRAEMQCFLSLSEDVKQPQPPEGRPGRHLIDLGISHEATFHKH